MSAGDGGRAEEGEMPERESAGDGGRTEEGERRRRRVRRGGRAWATAGALRTGVRVRLEAEWMDKVEV